MNNSGVKIEAHLIQNFAPSNLNRDDTGQPKSATFGGFRRARISSQCSKRNARERWRTEGTVSVGERTKKIQKLIGDRLAEDKAFMEKVSKLEDWKDGIRVFTEAYYAGTDKKKPENTSVLIFIGPEEVNAGVQAVKDLWEDRTSESEKKGKKSSETVEGIATLLKKLREFNLKNASKEETANTEAVELEESSGASNNEEVDQDKSGNQKDKRPKLKPVKEIQDAIEKARISADIALFGRMLAEQPGRNTDGACQVSHPISTHKVDMEMDFYTAVDDLNPEEETGAGMMGVVGFNSACYYRYALVDRDQLARNLARKTERKNGQWVKNLTQEDYTEADKVIKAFLEAMVYAIPTGKQNSFAAQNLPSFGLFVRRQGGVPISLTNAFAKPVRPQKDDDDLVGLSVAALTRHWEALKTVYGAQGVQSTACFHLQQEGRLNGLKDADKKNVSEAIKTVLEVGGQP
ncbi:MAG TPA: type I-E CRISPR-associated protein Cas7/Cse4/CasC [Desulfobacteraceae bacterium]|nr:type I-E CRISPR-associated protein Cas7/Cse4/CasC [Desulfobacteraceae bacterium]